MNRQFTYYTDVGKGEPVILIHGVGLDLTMWEQQVYALSSQYRVISYDMMGHGKSACPPVPYTLSQFVEQLDVLFSNLDIPQAHLIGFSMGGLVAQSYAIQHPEKLSSLTLISSVARRNDEQRKGVLSRIKEVEEHGHKTTINAAIKRWFTRTFISEHPEVIRRIRYRLETNNPDAYLAAYRVFATADAEVYDRLPEIKCPTLIVTGELDQGSTPEMAELMGNLIPHSEVVIIPGIKHMLPIEAGGQLNQLLLSTLEKYSGREWKE
ncbi:alpha/beta hydrolase [Aeribacillus pallidus]|uniref:alpha/beta fold hydrolase n=1 Tax=Aeribacillus TaxID=1055323 RepID=UPI000AF87D86|nr:MULTISPECIES: alpha/beta hydrolase [Aeribacillus]MDR9797637.1 alpha/beta hydrolase [Aeribacillus pallidus]MED0652308.1 alpha/beta hydrolase [Aeribacillus composti]MED4488489.1 alpha/beta hydrolase [Aeribacillus pallidus]